MRKAIEFAEVIDSNQDVHSVDYFLNLFWSKAKNTHSKGNKLMFVGNGGSSTIASHMAEDYSKAGKIRSMAFNDSAFLTCLGNDIGFSKIFSEQINLFAQPGDVLVAISSSGNSQNIIESVKAARKKNCWITTLSGFNADNLLRKMGDINIYIPSDKYGFVEINHLAICHAALDLGLYKEQLNNNNSLKVAV